MTTHPTTEQLSAFLDAELPPADAAAVEAHVRACAECRAWLDDMRALDGVVDSTLPAAPAGYFETFGARLQPRLAPRRRPFVRPWMAAAAAAVVVAVLVPLMRVEEKSATAPTAAAPTGGGAPPPPATVADELAKRPRADHAPAPAAPSRAQAPDPASRDRLEQQRQAPPPPPAAPAAEPKKLEDAVASREEADAEAAEAFAEAPQETRSAAAPAATVSGVPAAAAPDVDERGADLARRKAETAPKAVGGLAATTPRAPTAEEARARREAARRRAATSEGAAADAARLEIVEMGVQAWRLTGSAEDRRQALADADAYLRWPGARNAPRVRALRDELRR